MERDVQGAHASDLPNSEYLLEEFKHVAEESRFVMTRYMQAVALYLAFLGFAFKAALDSPTPKNRMLILIAVTLMNCLSGYAGPKFRSMAYHALQRQAILADELRFQRPHHMIWGYYTGIILGLLSEGLFVGLLFVR